MSASRETANASKDDEEADAGAGTTQTPTSVQGEEGREMNAGKISGNKILRIMELVQLHTVHIDFKGERPEVGAVLGLLSKNYISERLLTN